MVSFFELWERMESVKSPLMNSGEDSKAIQVIRAGLNLRKEDETPFWDDLMQLCSNADGLAELLDVDSATVVSWPSKIRELMGQIEDHNQAEGNPDEEKKVMPTGDNGAFVPPDNMDPSMGEL